MIRRPPRSTLFPSTPLFRSKIDNRRHLLSSPSVRSWTPDSSASPMLRQRTLRNCQLPRSEEHTSELQSRLHLVCRLLLEKKKNIVPHPLLPLSPSLTPTLRR